MSLRQQLVTAPVRYPVTIPEARSQLQLDSQDHDPRLGGLIAAATEHVETYTGRALITRTYHAFLNGWPLSNRGNVERFIRLARAPLQSVAFVKTYDDSDVPTTFDPSNYFVDTADPVGRVVLRRFAVWPVSLALRVANCIEIQWTCGYGDNPADTPEAIRLAIRMMIGIFNEQRGDETDAPDTPPAAKALLAPYLVLH